MFGIFYRKKQKELNRIINENADLRQKLYLQDELFKAEKQQTAIYCSGYEQKKIEVAQIKLDLAQSKEELDKYKSDNLTLMGRVSVIEPALAESRTEAVNRLGDLNNARSKISALEQALDAEKFGRANDKIAKRVRKSKKAAKKRKK